MTSSVRLGRLFLALAALSLPFTAARAQDPTPPRTVPGLVAISPDATTVAWTLRQREGSTLHLTSIANPDPAKEQLIAPNGATNCSNTSPLWSPDGQTLAFISTCTSKEEKPGQQQIFLWSKADGTVKQLTHVTGNIAQPAWSPDGKTIAFLFVENATRSAGALDAMKPMVGVIGEDTFEVQGIYAVDVTSGKGNWLIPATPQMYVYEFSWAPSSTQIAFVGAEAPGENNWWVAKLYTVCVQDHGIGFNACNPNSILDTQKISGPLHGLQIAVPRWSPDGKRLSFIGGLMSDQGSTGGDVWVVNADGTHLYDATPNIDGTPTFALWTRNTTLGFVEDRRGHTHVVDWDADKRALIPGGDLDLGEVSAGGGPIKNGVSYTPANIYTLATKGGLQKLTHLNDTWKPATKTISIEWTNEGFHVQGWLTFPKDFDPAKKYPMIVEVHGGPSASFGPRGDAEFSALGYFVFQPNPRGSFGQGEKFVQANVKDFGYGDLRDILTGIDAIEKQYPVDDHRLGLTGWSYGGFMSMFAETQTHRFHAIVAGAGISDWKSYYGENSIDQWMIPFFGASVYDDPAIYAKSSALEYIKKAKTPMLIIVGERDGECPAPQSFEMWHALRAEGVKTQLVVYPNEGHGFRDPAHIKDRNERTAKWFADNLK